MNDLYVAGIDGIDIGASQTSDNTKNASDFCMVILKRAFGINDPQIVAIYKDRVSKYLTALHNATNIGQTALQEELIRGLITNRYESVLYHHNFLFSQLPLILNLLDQLKNAFPSREDFL